MVTPVPVFHRFIVCNNQRLHGGKGMATNLAHYRHGTWLHFWRQGRIQSGGGGMGGPMGLSGLEHVKHLSLMRLPIEHASLVSALAGSLAVLELSH